jgi:hypothetical protein
LGGPRRPQRDRARQHLPADQGGSEAARPKINFSKSSAVFAPAAFRRSLCPAALGTAHWWRAIVPSTQPRTGGAYDSDHRTAGIAGRTRRRGGLAARGARAAERSCVAHRSADRARVIPSRNPIPQAPWDRIRANADNRKASRTSLFERLGSQRRLRESLRGKMQPSC